MPQLSGAFRTSGFGGSVPNPNMQDGYSAGPNGYTNGSQLIDGISAQPVLTQQWSITTWAITCFLGIVPAAPGPLYGRLGRLLAGLLIGVSPTAIHSLGGNPFTDIPPTSDLQTIWDGGTDTTPPVGSTSVVAGGGLKVAKTFVPASPVMLAPGQQLFVGLWLTPSLGQNISLYVLGAQYQIYYDVANRRR